MAEALPDDGRDGALEIDPFAGFARTVRCLAHGTKIEIVGIPAGEKASVGAQNRQLISFFIDADAGATTYCALSITTRWRRTA
jgi:hypothetical protein